jgi:pSer/pThr/pTyr-binding forkhead associated (FHA) protein
VPAPLIGRDPLMDEDAPPTLPGDRDNPSTGTFPGGPSQPGQQPWAGSVPTAAEIRGDAPPPLGDHGHPGMGDHGHPGLVEPPEFEDAPTGVDAPSSTPTRPGTVRLVLVGRDGEEGEAFPMTSEAIAVGRERGEILFPDDAFMSPAHARVERSGDVFTLVDLGSINGVYLKIRGNAAVYPGDLFMVGHQVLRLENVIEPVQEQPPGPDGTRTFGTPLKPAWGKLALVGRGGVAGDSYFLRGAKVIFGREQGDILFPHDPFVSREHARLRLELHGAQMAVFLEDLGSANGTYIRIRGSAEVRGRDTFRIGDQILRLRLDR